MNNIKVSCYEDSNIIVRFFNHFQLGIKKDIGEHKKNIIEKLGDVGLWSLEELPKKVWKIMKDPKVVTLALTAFALLATSIIFYPATSLLAIKAAILLIPQVPLWSLKFAAYVSVVGVIISTALRAEGRFLNKDLMQKFYRHHEQAPTVVHQPVKEPEVAV